MTWVEWIRVANVVADVVVVTAIYLRWRQDRQLRRDIDAFLERVRELRGPGNHSAVPNSSSPAPRVAEEPKG